MDPEPIRIPEQALEVELKSEPISGHSWNWHGIAGVGRFRRPESASNDRL